VQEMTIDSRQSPVYACLCSCQETRRIAHQPCEVKGVEMSTLTLAYKVRSYSTGTHGRAICNARTHHGS
jgi:hypothetical protein